MKKLLFFLSFIVTCYIGQSQALVTIKGGQFGVGSLLPINPFTLVGNPTAGIAVPQAFGIGYGLIFQGGKLAVDTTIKDTVFAANGLQWIGPGTKTIGLGGFMSQNTVISGSNLYALTFDSFPAASGRGIRWNVGNDAGYDVYYRDSATGFIKNLGKGAIGQVIGRPPGGGIGWINQTGGGGVAPVIQTIIGGPTVTVNNGTDILQVNSTSVIPSLTVTLPNTWPTRQEVKICFTANGGIAGGSTMVTSITVVNGAGQTLSQSVNPNGTSVTAGENIIYDLIGTVDQRIQ